MNAETIDYISAAHANVATLDQLNHAEVDILQRSQARFIARYAQPDYGWTAAAMFANKRLPFPLTMTGRDAWVFRAYCAVLDPSYRDNVIEEAHYLARRANHAASLRPALEGLLLSAASLPPDEAVEKVSNKMGVSRDVIEAYEVLFFNVLDRAKDNAYLAAMVYPETRAVELREDYHKTVTLSDLVRRLGYNKRDIDLTAYIAGLGDRAPMAKLAASSRREEELTQHFMAAGLLLSSTNLLNQRSSGLSRATTLVAASRSAGPVIDKPPVLGIGDLIQEEIRVASEHAVAAQHAARMKSYTGETIEA